MCDSLSPSLSFSLSSPHPLLRGTSSCFSCHGFLSRRRTISLTRPFVGRSRVCEADCCAQVLQSVISLLRNRADISHDVVCFEVCWLLGYCGAEARTGFLESEKPEQVVPSACSPFAMRLLASASARSSVPGACAASNSFADMRRCTSMQPDTSNTVDRHSVECLSCPSPHASISWSTSVHRKQTNQQLTLFQQPLPVVSPVRCSAVGKYPGTFFRFVMPKSLRWGWTRRNRGW